MRTKKPGCPVLRYPAPGSRIVDFGFEPGHKIVADITKGQIVIKLADAEEYGKKWLSLPF